MLLCFGLCIIDIYYNTTIFTSQAEKTNPWKSTQGVKVNAMSEWRSQLKARKEGKDQFNVWVDRLLQPSMRPRRVVAVWVQQPTFKPSTVRWLSGTMCWYGRHSEGRSMGDAAAHTICSREREWVALPSHGMCSYPRWCKCTTLQAWARDRYSRPIVCRIPTKIATPCLFDKYSSVWVNTHSTLESSLQKTSPRQINPWEFYKILSQRGASQRITTICRMISVGTKVGR